MKILVVDDNPDVLYSMKIGLESLSDDYNIISVESGEDCLDALSEGIPDLIFLDLMMPKMNGWDVIDHIQKNNNWKDIPIIIFTAADDPKYQKNAEKFGMIYVKKPFSINLIKEKIEQLNK